MGTGTHMGSFPPWGLLAPHGRWADMVWGWLRGRNGAATYTFQFSLTGTAYLSAGIRAAPWLGWAGQGGAAATGS